MSFTLYCVLYCYKVGVQTIIKLWLINKKKVSNMHSLHKTENSLIGRTDI